MLQVPSLADRIDGAIICTSHSSHFEIGKLLLREDDRRRKAGGKPLHIMMEKPMTTNVHEAKDLHELVISRQPIDRIGCFLLNHSANYREQTKVAQAIVKDGKLGTIRHVTASFAAPLSWLFDDPANKGWNEPDSTGTMLGNGFAWGQSSHILAWIFHVGCGQIQPRKVFCIMSHSERTGADVAHTASIQCDGEVTFALSGTSLLPGCQYSTSPVGKEVHIEMFGSKGALMYHGNDLDPSSGRLEFRLGGNDKDAGKAEVLCANLGFLFENAAQGGQGPESLQNFVTACFSKKMYAGADSKIGLMTVQAIEAMYRSQSSGKVEVVVD
mmetsp:Transcript_4157/g.11460  ORF Transcript_4157/g.11460 Transcript_4157/m.11460 type:complete len:327 (-) Transcript_4157:23-1003(-)